MRRSKKTSQHRDIRPGRPRHPAIDRAIIKATLKLLAEHGYQGMSVEGVASEAGVGKTTIYRRYASKEELVVAAVGALRDDVGPLPDTGNVRADLVKMLDMYQVVFERGLSTFGALLVEERRTPELFELFRERIMGPRRDEAVRLLQRGVERGEIRSDVDLEAAMHALVGSMFIRRILGPGESRDKIEQTVDIVWRGLATNP